MTLREWITAQALTQRAAAVGFGVHEITLNRWINNKAIPRREQMATIVSVTGGAVQPASFFAPSEAA